MNTKYSSNSLKINRQRNSPLSRSVHACRRMAAKFHQLREKLIWKLALDVQGLVPAPAVRRAVTEAEALACSTPYPLLFLPDLAEEKVLNAREWAGRQRQVLERQRSLSAIL